MKKTIVFATEIPALLKLDLYHTQETTLFNIYKRMNTYNETKPIYQKIKIGCETPETKIEFRKVNPDWVENTQLKTFQRELTPTIVISGRCFINAKNAIEIHKKRKRLHYGLYEEELCLAQIYLWLVNVVDTVVLFVEQDNDGKKHVTVVHKTECEWQKQIPLLLHDFILKTNCLEHDSQKLTNGLNQLQLCR